MVGMLRVNRFDSVRNTEFCRDLATTSQDFRTNLGAQSAINQRNPTMAPSYLLEKQDYHKNKAIALLERVTSTCGQRKSSPIDEAKLRSEIAEFTHHNSRMNIIFYSYFK